jgi:hypothetical protein
MKLLLRPMILILALALAQLSSTADLIRQQAPRTPSQAKLVRMYQS